jgi:hypothetical protein
VEAISRRSRVGQMVWGNGRCRRRHLGHSGRSRGRAGTVTFPPGIYKITCTIAISTACRLLGLGTGPGGNNQLGNNDEHGAILEWSPPEAMDMFLVTGVPGNVGAGVGTTFENLLFRQAATCRWQALLS